MIGTNGSKPQRECTKIGPYMTTIFVQNKPKLSIKNPNYRIEGGMIMTNKFKGNSAVDDGP